MTTELLTDAVEELASGVLVTYGEQPQALPDSYLDLLAPDELARWERYRFARDRDRFLWSRVLLRTTLSDFLDVEPQDWKFTTTTHGKPEISLPNAARGLRFNLSHTEGLAVVALAWKRDVGVDVEHRSRKVTPQLVEFALTSAERADWETFPEDQRAARFLEYWTLKEAYLKALGLGMSHPLRSFAFEVPFDDTAPTLAASIYSPSFTNADEWHFFREQPTADHLLALAVQRLPDVDARLEIRPSSLV